MPECFDGTLPVDQPAGCHAPRAADSRPVQFAGVPSILQETEPIHVWPQLSNIRHSIDVRRRRNRQIEGSIDRLRQFSGVPQHHMYGPFGLCPAPSSTNRALSWNTWPMSISRGMYNCRSSLKDMDWWLKAAFDSWISVLQNATNRRLRSGESSSLSASMPAASVQRNSTASRRHHLAMLWIGGAFAGSIVPRFTASWIRLHAPRVEAIEALE